MAAWRPLRIAGADPAPELALCNTRTGHQAQRRLAGQANAALVKANRRAERLEAELTKTRMALEIMGKAHALLEMLAESAEPDPKPKP